MERRKETRLAAVLAAAVLLAGCGSTVNAGSGGRILAVGAENEYANVISQIGGRYVDAVAIESNPNTDPHTFEASPSVAARSAGARLVVQNGVGYDGYMEKIEAAAGELDSRKVIDVQKLLGLPDSTPNPHLWYKPDDDARGRQGAGRRPLRARARARRLLQGQRAALRQLAATVARRLRAFTRQFRGVPVATTEPVGRLHVRSRRHRNLTPLAFRRT